jgi:hypothetical protein
MKMKGNLKRGKPLQTVPWAAGEQMRMNCILRPIKDRHAEGVEVRVSAGTEETLKPEVASHETEEVDRG